MDMGSFLSAAWQWATSEQASNFWQNVMGLAIIFVVLEYAHERRRNRIEQDENQQAALEALKAKRDEIDDNLLALYFKVLDDFIEHPELDEHDAPLDSLQKVKQQRRIYEKVILLFATAFGRLYNENTPEMRESWQSWEDEINDWIALNNFRNALDELLVGETDSFIAYMEGKKNQFEQEHSITLNKSGPERPPQP
jgi:hypothetical protein